LFTLSSALEASADGPLPLNDDTAAPFKGVYRWGQSGCVHGLYDAYGPWLNRNVIWAEDFMPIETWDNLEGQSWQMGTWGPWVAKVPGRRYILSLPMLPGGWSGKGPSSGTGAHIAVSLEEGAKGTYNPHFTKLAESLVKHGLGNTIIRVGWEFNGGWYTWRAQSDAKAKAYAAYFHQIVTAMRAVPGAENLKFDWNPALMWNGYPFEDAWPGDDVVDYIGLDVYDQSWVKDTYPIPAGATADETLQRQKAAWDAAINNNDFGLPFWLKFAAKHNKPLTFPEWGVCNRKDGHGGGDNVYFIQQMFDFIYNPANNVYFESYFDVVAGDGDHQLCPDPEGKIQTKFPNAAAKFKELFSLPPGTAPAPAPAPATPTTAPAPAKP
jgi:hypothetical protein